MVLLILIRNWTKRSLADLCSVLPNYSYTGIDVPAELHGNEVGTTDPGYYREQFLKFEHLPEKSRAYPSSCKRHRLAALCGQGSSKTSLVQLLYLSIYFNPISPIDELWYYLLLDRIVLSLSMIQDTYEHTSGVQLSCSFY